MNKYKKLFSNTVILGIGTFASKLLVFLLMPLYTALLSTSQFGTAELITNTANMIIPIACVGISNGIFRFAAERNTDQTKVFSSSMALLGGGSVLFLILLPIVFIVPHFDGYEWLIPLYVILANVQAVFSQYVRAIDRTKLFALQGILNTLLTVSFNVMFLWGLHMGVTGYVLSVIFGNLFTSLFLLFAAKLWRVFKVSRIDRALVWEMLRFSLPMIPTTICWAITDLSDLYLVAYFRGDAVNGVYSAAYKIPTVVTLISSIFMQAWQFSAVAESSDEDSCKRFYGEVFGGFVSVVMICASGLILFSPILCSLLLHSSYARAAAYMPALLCAAAVEAVVSFLATIYMVKKKSMNSFITAVSGAMLNIILNLIMIPRLGAIGAALATFSCYLFVFGLRAVDTRRYIRFRLHLPRLLLSIGTLLVSCLFMSYRWTGWLAVVLTCTVLICAVNFPFLWRSVRGVIQKRKG